MERFFAAITLILLTVFISNFPTFTEPIKAEQPASVLAVQTDQSQLFDPVLGAPTPLHTTSRFETKLETQSERIERKTVYKDDPEREIDNNATLQEGKDGKKTKVFEVLYFEGKEYTRDLVSTDVEQPEDKIIAKGSKIVWRNLQTPEGEISYWRKLRVWATHYDSHCPGCDQWTAIGMKAGKGVIAVDPSVIKLRSQLYVPGYGKAVAGDTGGAIKGNIIDLGFEDARMAGWSAHFVDVYLLN